MLPVAVTEPPPIKPALIVLTGLFEVRRPGLHLSAQRQPEIEQPLVSRHQKQVNAVVVPGNLSKAPANPGKLRGDLARPRRPFLFLLSSPRHLRYPLTLRPSAHTWTETERPVRVWRGLAPPPDA